MLFRSDLSGPAGDNPDAAGGDTNNENNNQGNAELMARIAALEERISGLERVMSKTRGFLKALFTEVN